MIYFLVPIFNEELNIPDLHKELSSTLPGQDKFFLFSDDGSSDRSVELLRKYFGGSSYHIIEPGVNSGPGNAFRLGYNWIVEHCAEEDTLVTIEADGTSDLSILPVMLSVKDHGYDLVLASVYAQGGGFDKTSFFRRLISSAGNLTFRFAFDLKILTLSSFYRVYSVGLLKRIREKYGEIITEKGFTCMLEFLIKALNSNCKVIEVPMTLHSSKRKGRSKMKIMKTMFSYIKVIFKFRFSSGISK